jgi:hypothetical protein
MQPNFPQPIEAEEWRRVEGAPQYLVSSEGRVWSEKTERLLRQSTSATGGYPRVPIGNRYVPVHILVCVAFHGPRPAGMQAAHLDGRASNAKAVNLAWVTPAENAAHKRDHGTARLGEAHPHAKLRESDVLAMRSLWRGGTSWRSIAKQFGVSPTTARMAGTGVNFSHLPGPCPTKGQPGARSSGHARVLSTTIEERSRAGREAALRQHAARGSPVAKLTSEGVSEIRRRLASGERQANLAREYGVGRSAICAIAKGRAWAKGNGMRDAPC